MSVRLDQVEPVALPDVRDQIVRVYREAFAPPPHSRGESDAADFASSIDAHAILAGFRCVVARLESTGEVVGFTYGVSVAPNQWWYRQVAPQVGEAEAAETFADVFRVVQLAVVPAAQRRGLGEWLHDALLTVAPGRGAVLSTLDADTPAVRLYRRRGRGVMLRPVRFPGAEQPYLVMRRERLTAFR